MGFSICRRYCPNNNLSHCTYMHVPVILEAIFFITDHLISECLADIYAVYCQCIRSLTIMNNQIAIFVSSRRASFFAILPRLLVSKGISRWHFLLRQIHSHHLKYILYNIFDTFSSFEAIYYLFETAFALAC